MTKCKYDFYEIVKINSDKPSLGKVNGLFGVIRGISQSEENPEIFAYAVDVLTSTGTVKDGWFIFEEDLQPTGKKADPKKFKTGESVRVQVDLETGEGRLADRE
jgi:hypothetical protein